MPPGETPSPLLADALLAEAVREGLLTPPALSGKGAPPRIPVEPYRDLELELAADRADRSGRRFTL